MNENERVKQRKQIFSVWSDHALRKCGNCSKELNTKKAEKLFLGMRKDTYSVYCSEKCMDEKWNYDKE